MSDAQTPKKSSAPVSIIIACLSEENTIEEVIHRIFKTLPCAQVLVVSGGRDRTNEIVRGLEPHYPALRLIINENDRGKGHAIRVGVEAASHPYHAQIDADIQFLPEELPRLLEPIVSGRADVSLGSRFIKGSVRKPGSTPLLRTAGNLVASAWASLLFGQRLTDVQAGFKAWTAECIRNIGLTSDNYSYEAEIAVKSVAKGSKVVDVPITTLGRRGGASNVNVAMDGIHLLWDIAKFRF